MTSESLAWVLYSTKPKTTWTPAPFQIAGPFQIGFFVEPRLDLDQDSPIVAAADRGGRGRQERHVPGRDQGAVRRRSQSEMGPRSERAGVHVVFGFVEYKTHAKLSLVIRREGDGLKNLTATSAPANYHRSRPKFTPTCRYSPPTPPWAGNSGKFSTSITGYAQPESLEKTLLLADHHEAGPAGHDRGRGKER